MRPRCSVILGPKSVFLRAFGCASVPSSSIPIKRQEPATSAARIAASRRSTCSLLKMPHRLGEIECLYSKIVGRCPAGHQCPTWVNRAVLTTRPSLPVFPDKRTCPVLVGMSQTCHERKFHFYLSPRGACRLGCHSGSPAFRNPSSYLVRSSARR